MNIILKGIGVIFGLFILIGLLGAIFFPPAALGQEPSGSGGDEFNVQTGSGGDEFIVVSVTEFSPGVCDVKLRNLRTGYVHSVSIYDCGDEFNVQPGQGVHQQNRDGRPVLIPDGQGASGSGGDEFNVRSGQDGRIEPPAAPPPSGDDVRIPLPIDPHIRSGSKCRGACGPDCPSTCVPQPDKEICVYDPRTNTHQNWKYTGIILCGSAKGCREHDQCYDNCADGEWPALCRRSCDVACVTKHNGNCALWLVGKGPFDRSILFSNDPVSISGHDEGPCPAIGDNFNSQEKLIFNLTL